MARNGLYIFPFLIKPQIYDEFIWNVFPVGIIQFFHISYSHSMIGILIKYDGNEENGIPGPATWLSTPSHSFRSACTRSSLEKVTIQIQFAVPKSKWRSMVYFKLKIPRPHDSFSIIMPFPIKLGNLDYSFMFWGKQNFRFLCLSLV